MKKKRNLEVERVGMRFGIEKEGVDFGWRKRESKERT